MIINKVVIPCVAIYAFYKYRKHKTVNSTNEELILRGDLISIAQEILSHLVWKAYKKKAYNYASNLIYGSNNYDYWKQEESIIHTNTSFKKYALTVIDEDPARISPSQAKSIGVYDKWLSSLIAKLAIDHNYVSPLVLKEWNLERYIATELFKNVDNNFKSRIKALVEYEPAAVSEHYAKLYGFYDQWKSNLDRKITEDPDYLNNYWNLDN